MNILSIIPFPPPQLPTFFAPGFVATWAYSMQSCGIATGG